MPFLWISDPLGVIIKNGDIMIKVDLITGFLGSGKTTFIKRYAKHLLRNNKNIGILENDYGAVNVDMMLLGELRSHRCEIETVAGACDRDCHKRRFKTKLIAMGMLGYDRVLIEPSGIFDVDEFFDTLREEPLDRWYEIGNVFAVVEGNLEHNLSEKSEFLLISQIANAGKIILSRIQECSSEDIDNTINYINILLKKYNCAEREKTDFLIADWDNLNDNHYNMLMNAGYSINNLVKLSIEEDLYSTVYFTRLKGDTHSIVKNTHLAFKDKTCGNIFRIKGFIKEGDTWYEINSTKGKTTVNPVGLGQEVIIVIGENLNKDKIGKYFS